MDAKLFWEILKGILLLFVGALIARKFEKRPKLISYYGHVSAFKHTTTQGNTIDVFSHSVILRNSGNLTATNVRMNHRSLPDFTIYPSVNHRTDTLPDGSVDIVIPNMVPKEQITISYLYFPPLTYDITNSGIKCDQGFAKQIKVLLQQEISGKTKYFILSVFILGLSTLFYLSFNLIKWIGSVIPVP